MKHFFCAFLLFAGHCLYAESQLPDLLIIEKDTIEIYNFPLEDYLKKNPSNYLSKLRADSARYEALSCDRGYRATWRLEKGALYLVHIVDCSEEETPVNFFRKIFKEKYVEGRVRADWYSSYLVKHGEGLLRQNPRGVNYGKEVILHFKDGLLVNEQTVENYTDLSEGLSRLKEEEIKQVLLKEINKLNWEVLGPAMCDEEYLVTIDEKGKISQVVPTPTFESGWDNYRTGTSMKKCAKVLKKAFSGLQFDLLKWNGNPYKELLKVRFFYNADTGKVESVL